MGAIVHVVAGALIDAKDRVLLAQRHADAHQGGLWEFPGGKLEPGEAPADGLRRELDEELGIDMVAHRPLIRVTHHYPDRSVLLDVHLVTEWRGDVVGREGQPLAWSARNALDGYAMPAADVPIVKALQLPSVYLITPPSVGEENRFLASLDNALQAGIRLVQLRLFDIVDAQLEDIGSAVVQRCDAYGARVLFNGDPQLARRIGAHGVHLSGRRLYEEPANGKQRHGLLAASCHSPKDLQQAARIGADFAVLSPVLPTRSHPDQEPLGWETFAQWVEAAQLPVFALGGMQPSFTELAWQKGAQGVAGIRGIWSDEPAG